MSQNAYSVKFDRRGMAYVETTELLRQPEVQKQWEAARRVMQKLRHQATEPKAAEQSKKAQ